MAFDCVLQAWREHEAELRHFLTGRASSPEAAEDLLQDVFLKAMAEGYDFCELTNARAWLFRVARNRLIDTQRTARTTVDLAKVDPGEPQAPDNPITELQSCIARNLPLLAREDREIIEACDLEGVPQKAYAGKQGLTLPATKARIQRARQRLREKLIEHCRVILDEQGRVCCHKEAGIDGSV